MSAPARSGFARAVAHARQNDDHLVLDGGLGTSLERSGHDLTSALWSARLLVDDPGVIRAAHLDFYAAGATIGISSSYQVSYEALAGIGLDHSETTALLARSVRLVEEAREQYLAVSPVARHDAGRPLFTAASVGPYGAMLADGSEYTGRYGIGTAELRRWHRPRLEALIAAGADVLAIETIPSLAESEAVLQELSGSGSDAWLAFTVADGALRSGESLAEAFAMAGDVPEIVAVGINCSDPGEVGAAISAAREHTDKAIIVYPNSGERWDAKNRRWSGEAGFPDSAVRDWISLGATVVGGCCRVGPAETGAIAAAVA